MVLINLRQIAVTGIVHLYLDDFYCTLYCMNILGTNMHSNHVTGGIIASPEHNLLYTLLFPYVLI